MTAEEGEYRWPVSESTWISAYERRLQRLEDNVTSLARTVIGMEKDMKEVNSSIVHRDWRYILRRAWSVRFIAIAAILSGLETVLPMFSGWVDPGTFSMLSSVFASAALVARIVAQKGL